MKRPNPGNRELTLPLSKEDRGIMHKAVSIRPGMHRGL